MADGQLRTVVHHLRRLIGPPPGAGVPDAQLLERFVRHRDPAAFELLVRRYERMVHGVCRRVLRDPNDADDAFQATFLVFVRKAGSISRRESVGGWLYRVAYRVALRARAAAARQLVQPLTDEPLEQSGGPDEQAAWRDLRPLLDQELNRLPEKYRVPVVLCYLESRTYEEAARQLGCSRGTVSTRLTRARELLRRRLTRRGLALSGGLLAGLLAEQAAPAAPAAALVEATLKAALLFAADKAAAAGLVPATVLTLTHGALHAMLLTKLKVLTGVLAALAFFGLGAGALTYRVVAAEQDNPRAKEARDDQPRKEEASKNGLDQTDAPKSGLDQSPREPTPAPKKEEPAPEAKPGTWQERANFVWTKDEFTSVKFSPDGRLLATGSRDGSVQLWEVASAKELRRLEAGASVYSVAFSPDGKLLATGGGERDKSGVGKLWDLSTGAESGSFGGSNELPKIEVNFRNPAPSPGTITSVAFAPDGQTLAFATREMAAVIWDIGRRQSRASVRTNGMTAFCVAFSPDGKLVASAGGAEFVGQRNMPGQILLIDAATGKELLGMRPGDTATSVAFAPDGKTLATGGFDKTVRIWDVATGREVRQSAGHSDVVRSVAFSPDGRTLASGGFDGTVRVWHAASGKEVAILKGVGGGVMSVAFSPDGRLLAAAGGEPGKSGQARLWTVPAQTPQRPAGSRMSGDRLDQQLDRLDRLLQELVASKRSDEQAVEALYLATLTRFPADSEKKMALDHLAKQKDRQEGLANVLWALVNSKEFAGSTPENLSETLKKLNLHEFGRPKQ
jgi:RNA polymerase sigma factor (sigma-70 family)